MLATARGTDQPILTPNICSGRRACIYALVFVRLGGLRDVLEAAPLAEFVIAHELLARRQEDRLLLQPNAAKQGGANAFIADGVE